MRLRFLLFFFYLFLLNLNFKFAASFYLFMYVFEKKMLCLLQPKENLRLVYRFSRDQDVLNTVCSANLLGVFFCYIRGVKKKI